MVPIAFLAIVAIVVAAVLYAPRRRVLTCRWRRDPRRAKTALTQRWVCADCGVEAFTEIKRPPADCKRHARDAVL